MFINSGDIVVMWGESRLNYHAVPRIVDTKPCLCDIDYLKTFRSLYSEKQEAATANTLMDYDLRETLRTLEWEPYAAYLTNSRINMNVRQVLPSNVT